MDRLGAMEMFVRVAETGSFSEAARQMTVSKSIISKSVSALEDHLGARLLNRTTRRISLTEVGAAYLARCQRILSDVEEAELATSEAQAHPRGTLKINAPMSFGFAHLAPAIPDFVAEYPDVDIDMSLNDRFVDLIDEGYDLAVRIGGLADSSLIARKVSRATMITCVAPRYLSLFGTPEEPDELSEHACLCYSLVSSATVWTFTRPAPEGGKPQEVAVKVKPALLANNGDAIAKAAIGAMGICRQPSFIVGEALRDGALVPLFPEWDGQEIPIHAVYPHNRHLSAKVRVFVDFLVRRFGPKPYWEP